MTFEANGFCGGYLPSHDDRTVFSYRLRTFLTAIVALNYRFQVV